jgi:hypothetical protein
MMTQLNVHGVVGLTLGPIDHFRPHDGAGEFWSRTITLHGGDGADVQVTLFGDRDDVLLLPEERAEAEARDAEVSEHAAEVGRILDHAEALHL